MHLQARSASPSPVCPTASSHPRMEFALSHSHMRILWCRVKQLVNMRLTGSGAGLIRITVRWQVCVVLSILHSSTGIIYSYPVHGYERKLREKGQFVFHRLNFKYLHFHFSIELKAVATPNTDVNVKIPSWFQYLRAAVCAPTVCREGATGGPQEGAR